MTAKNNTIWVRSHGNAIVENDVVLRVEGFLIDIDKYRAKEASFDLLKQKHNQLNTFNHVITHDLRNHANNIVLLASMVETDTLDEDNAELVDKIAQIANIFKSTIEHLSDIIKVNENQITSESVNFQKATDAASTLLQPELLQSEANIHTDFTVPDVIFPKLYLGSIFTNLITNSIKYKKPLEKPEILISTYKDDDTNAIILEYQDNGIGIDLKKHGNKIFGLYQTFTDRPGAHGVGLFLVKTQIESQGGSIVIESKPNVGTIFRIFFKQKITF